MLTMMEFSHLIRVSATSHTDCNCVTIGHSEKVINGTLILRQTIDVRGQTYGQLCHDAVVIVNTN